MNLLEAIRERSKVGGQQGGRQEAGLVGRQWSGERHDGGREVCKGGGKRFEVVGVVHNEVGVGHEEEDEKEEQEKDKLTL